MRVIILNTSNIVPDGDNNKLVYKFPNSILFKNNSIAVSQVSMYYSWFNITSALQNNIINYTWNGTPYTITIPDGLYEVADLNSLLQFTFIQNNQYLIDGNGRNVYYAEIILNPTAYAVQINTYLVPLSQPSGYTTPAGFVYPTTIFNPIIILPANINNILGFYANFSTPDNTGDTYIPPAGQNLIAKNGAGTISCLSTQAPDVQPNPSIYISVSNINNPYALPSSIIYTIVPTGAVGTLITDKPPQFIWNKMIDGTYAELRLTFLGSNLQPIPLNDPQMTIMLTIKDADETGLKS